MLVFVGKRSYFFPQERLYTNDANTEKAAIARIYGMVGGGRFPKKIFKTSGVDMALKRLADEGTIRRVMRGIYDYPRYSDLLKQNVAPDIHQIAQALARKFGWRIQADGASA